REPHERPAPAGLLDEAVARLLVVAGAVPHVVERVVDDEAPLVIVLAAQVVVPELADVAEADMAEALRVVPARDVVHAGVGDALDAHRVEQDVAEDALARALGVAPAELVEDGTEIDAL